MCFKQIYQEREGSQIDRPLLNNVVEIFIQIGLGSKEYYEVDLEAPLLQDTAAYYSRKASKWILEDSCPEYMLKVLLLRDHSVIITHLTLKASWLLLG